MAETMAAAAGQIGCIDLTVPNAESVRKFYEHATGWTASPVSVGDNNDYCMLPAGTGKAVAGVCHASGENAGLSPAWLIYMTVADLDESVRGCAERGGKVPVAERRIAGMGRYGVIQDPADPVAALYQGE